MKVLKSRQLTLWGHEIFFVRPISVSVISKTIRHGNGMKNNLESSIDNITDDGTSIMSRITKRIIINFKLYMKDHEEIIKIFMILGMTELMAIC